MDRHSAKYVTRALVTFTLLLFVIAELVVITTLWNVPNGNLNLGIVTKYLFPCVVGLPIVSGVKGFLTLKSRMLSKDYDTVNELSHQFLTTTIVAYAVIIFIVSVLH